MHPKAKVVKSETTMEEDGDEDLTEWDFEEDIVLAMVQ